MYYIIAASFAVLICCCFGVAAVVFVLFSQTEQECEIPEGQMQYGAEPVNYGVPMAAPDLECDADLSPNVPAPYKKELVRSVASDVSDSSPSLKAAANALPEWLSYHYFLSHKKHHSTLGTVMESIAQSIHDQLEAMGFTGFFDVDNLKDITQEELERHVL